MALNVEKLHDLYMECQNKMYQGMNEWRATTGKAIIEVFTHLRSVVNYTPCFGLPEIRIVAKESDIPKGSDHVKFGFPFNDQLGMDLEILRKQINGPDVIRPFSNIGNQIINNYGPRRERMRFDYIADHDEDHENIRNACQQLLHGESDRFSDFQLFILAVIYSKHCLECFIALMKPVIIPKHALTVIRLAGKEVECKISENEMKLATNWRDNENKKYPIPCWRLNQKYVAKLEAQVRDRAAELRQAEQEAQDRERVAANIDEFISEFVRDLSDDEDEGPIPEAVPSLVLPKKSDTLTMPKIEGRPNNGVKRNRVYVSSDSDSDNDMDVTMPGCIPNSDGQDEGSIPNAVPPLIIPKKSETNNGILDDRRMPATPNTMKMPKIEGRPKSGVMRNRVYVSSDSDSDNDMDVTMPGCIPNSDGQDEGSIPNAVPPLIIPKKSETNNGILDDRRMPATPNTMKMPKIEGRPKSGVMKSLSAPAGNRGNGQELKPAVLEDSGPGQVPDYDDIEEDTVVTVPEPPAKRGRGRPPGSTKSLSAPAGNRGNGQELKPAVLEDSGPGQVPDYDDIEEDTVVTVPEPPAKRGRGRPPGSTKKKRGRKPVKRESDVFSEHNYAVNPQKKCQNAGN